MTAHDTEQRGPTWRHAWKIKHYCEYCGKPAKVITAENDTDAEPYWACAEHEGLAYPDPPPFDWRTGEPLEGP